jgi:hypothetical protein
MYSACAEVPELTSPRGVGGDDAARTSGAESHFLGRGTSSSDRPLPGASSRETKVRHTTRICMAA